MKAGSLRDLLTAESAWNDLTSGTSNDLNAIDFVNINTGFVTGESSIILKTTNAGLNWVEKFNDVYDLYALQFPDNNTGYAIGERLYKTLNSGENWTEITSYPVNSYISSIYFLSTSEGFTATDEGEIIRTTNGGTSWGIVNPDGVLSLNSITFPTSSTGYATGEGFDAEIDKRRLELDGPFRRNT